jgi:alpha-glucuronidase
MKPTRRQFVATSVAGIASGIAKRWDSRAIDAAGAQDAQLPPEDGYKLWLRYAPLGAAAASFRTTIRQLVVQGTSDTAAIVRGELSTALASMLGEPAPAISSTVSAPSAIVGTPANSSVIRDLEWDGVLAKLGPEGYIVRAAKIGAHPVVVVASSGEIGALYGAFHLLRLIQTAQPLERVNLAERPRVQIRMLNHWDNLNGSVERGYAGRSLWQWAALPGTIDPRYADYARANASIGINGASPNNVNADVRVFSPEYLAKVAALANVWRPYGMRMYLSANVAAPLRVGGLKTADPLDKDVAAWWKAKADEIYELVPDFGGFVVKANSEGQPGPKDYGRSHAEGANVLADALAPHGGNVIWRAFIYDEDVDPDRAKRAYIEFTKLDGQFKPNVLVQVKNGAIDFMPREPFHPLFGALEETPVLAEIQATQEYLGQAKHLVYLGTMWEECLGADTHAKGKGTTVGDVIAGAMTPKKVTGIASVVNPGLDRNWCGHHFSQSNWYASGRLAWNPALSAQQIADEWTRMTFGNDRRTVDTIRDLMMSSRETFVNYTMPLGLHHLIGGDHYAPMPQNAKAPRADWTATYYHQATADAIGFDRTMKGNNAVGQYFPPVRDRFDNLATCPEVFLLWFHRLPWDYKTKSGKTLWAAMCEKYAEGARAAEAMQATWLSLAGRIDPQRHKEVADRLAIQVADAAKWRDHILQYFQSINMLPIASKQEPR